MVRASAGQMLLWLEYYAPEDTGKFVHGLAYRTDDRDSETTATFYVKGEHAYLLPFIVKGTQAHEIPKGGSIVQMAKGYPLHWVDRNTGQDRFAWSVWHPGTKPNPFIQQAQESASPFIRALVQTAARRVAFLEGE
jgi:hypothetical protein